MFLKSTYIEPNHCYNMSPLGIIGGIATAVFLFVVLALITSNDSIYPK